MSEKFCPFGYALISMKCLEKKCELWVDSDDFTGCSIRAVAIKNV